MYEIVEPHKGFVKFTDAHGLELDFIIALFQRGYGIIELAQRSPHETRRKQTKYYGGAECNQHIDSKRSQRI